MSRRRRRTPSVWIDWNEELAVLFFPYLLRRAWRPPGRVRLFAGDHHTTLCARFHAEDSGAVTTITMRIAR